MSMLDTMTTTVPLAAGGGGLTAHSADAAKNVILGIIGSFLVVIVAGRSLSALASDQYGKMLSLAAGASVVALFTFFPDSGVGILKGFASMFTGAQ